MKFIKMHGLGNDYVYVDCIRGAAVESPAEVAQIVSREHFGIGSDGLVLIEPSACADARMRIFNKDGSEAEMCGNAVRCVGRYLHDSGLYPKETVSVETGAGVMRIELKIENGLATSATVDMGAPVFEPHRIPVAAESNRIQIEYHGRTLNFFCVSMGNPHAVTTDIYPDGSLFTHMGEFIENHPLFPRRINVEFCRVTAPNRAEVRVWERGSGATLACGTGASAALAALASQNLTDRHAEIVLPGGSLDIDWREDGHIYMTGPATISFVGEFGDHL